MSPRNLADLGVRTPGASQAIVWSRNGQGHDAPGLASGKSGALPVERPMAWGVCWAVPHVLDGAALFVEGRLPAKRSLHVEVFDGAHWVPWTTGLTVDVDGGKHCVRFGFEPVATMGLRIRSLRTSPRVTRIEAYRRVVRNVRSCPKRLATRQLEQDMLTRRQEPNYEALSLCALPMPAWATVGLKDSAEVGVGWDGTLAVPRLSSRISFELGRPPKSLGRYRDTIRRELVDGWRPAVVLRGQVGAIEFTQTTFAERIGKEKKPVLFGRYEFSTSSTSSQRTTLRVRANVGNGESCTVKGSGLYAGRKLVVAVREQPRPNGDNRSLRFDVEVQPNETKRLELRVPLCSSFDRRPKALRDEPLAHVCARSEEGWDRQLARGMQVELPEERLNRLYKAVLTQILINGDDGVMAYGSYPSFYDGRVYGVEEAYCMLGLAEAGFSHDAQRYLDGTYLTKEFMRKADEYVDRGARHQQYRNGIVPATAVRAYRLNRDTRWIRKHVPLLVECAEWTMAARRKTMAEEDGKRPLHWGLLPAWAFGGDMMAHVCHTLHANLACLRGLVDTAWLLDELGNTEGATRYQRDASEYRQCINDAIDAGYMPDRDPPLLPLSLYSRRAEHGDFYQLFASVILELDLLDRSRAAYLTRFMEEDNRLLCGLCRFRGEYGPGGLDAVYSRGYLLHLLRRGDVRRFLLGFYAYIALNLEPSCFTSRETTMLYTADNQLAARGDCTRSDPLPCSSAVVLNLLRNMLVMEGLDEWGIPNGTLTLFAGAPRPWFGPGRRIAVTGAPTCYGPLSVEAEVAKRGDTIDLTLTPPTRNAYTTLAIRLPHPQHKETRKVTVNGRPHNDVDPRRESVLLTGLTRRSEIRVRF